MDMGIGGYEGGVEGALGEDRAEMVGQTEGDEEGIRNGTRAEDRSQHDVAGKAGQPREQRVGADGEDAPKHGPLSSPSNRSSKRRNQVEIAPRTAAMTRSWVASSR